VVLFTLIFYRLIFHDGLPKKLLPTIASITALETLKVQLFAWIATALLVLTALVVMTVLLKTICAFFSNKICVPD